MVSTSFMVDTSSHPRAQLHRCVEKSAYDESALIQLSPFRSRRGKNCSCEQNAIAESGVSRFRFRSGL